MQLLLDGESVDKHKTVTSPPPPHTHTHTRTVPHTHQPQGWCTPSTTSVCTTRHVRGRSTAWPSSSRRPCCCPRARTGRCGLTYAHIYCCTIHTSPWPSAYAHSCTCTQCICTHILSYYPDIPSIKAHGPVFHGTPVLLPGRKEREPGGLPCIPGITACMHLQHFLACASTVLHTMTLEAVLSLAVRQQGQCVGASGMGLLGVGGWVPGVYTLAGCCFIIVINIIQQQQQQQH